MKFWIFACLGPPRFSFPPKSLFVITISLNRYPFAVKLLLGFAFGAGQLFVASAEPPAWSLAFATDSTPGIPESGPLHLVGGEEHRLRLELRGTPDVRISLQGRMFQILSSTAAPVAEVKWLDEVTMPPSGVLVFQPSVSLPEITATTRYLIRFQQSGFPAISILSHPRDFLLPLVNATKARPLILIAPPAGIPELLNQLGIVSEIRSDASTSLQKGSVILSWRTLPSTTAVPPESRLIVCDQDELHREIWQSCSSSSWKVQVSSQACSLGSLQSTAGLAKLLYYTRFIPNH